MATSSTAVKLKRLRQRFGIGLAERGLCRHGNRAPFARSAFANALCQLGYGVGLASVFLGNFLVGRAYQLAVHCVAGHAGILLRQLQAGQRRLGHQGGRQHGGHKGQSLQIHLLWVFKGVCVYREGGKAQALLPASSRQLDQAQHILFKHFAGDHFAQHTLAVQCTSQWNDLARRKRCTHWRAVHRDREGVAVALHVRLH